VTLFQILSKTSTPSWTFFRTRSISPCNLRLAPIVQQFDHCQVNNYYWCVCFYYHSISQVINGRIICVCRSLFLGFFFFFLLFYSFRLLCWLKYGGDDGENWERGRRLILEWSEWVRVSFFNYGLGFVVIWAAHTDYVCEWFLVL
jgi:hypothetical protein